MRKPNVTRFQNLKLTVKAVMPGLVIAAISAAWFRSYVGLFIVGALALAAYALRNTKEPIPATRTPDPEPTRVRIRPPGNV